MPHTTGIVWPIYRQISHISPNRALSARILMAKVSAYGARPPPQAIRSAASPGERTGLSLFLQHRVDRRCRTLRRAHRLDHRRCAGGDIPAGVDMGYGRPAVLVDDDVPDVPFVALYESPQVTLSAFRLLSAEKPYSRARRLLRARFPTGSTRERGYRPDFASSERS